MLGENSTLTEKTTLFSYQFGCGSAAPYYSSITFFACREDF